ncbi:MAG: cyclic pyranopterin monophosphate synthase MoaC, partial [Candidatus Cloacimonadota bacterium]
MNKLTHFDESGRASMVDITGKENTERYAIAKGRVYMKPETI